MDDRRVHATNSTGACELVRYDKAGKWYLETRDLGRHHASLKRAVELAVYWMSTGGTVHLGLRGGSVFDRQVRKALDNA